MNINKLLKKLKENLGMTKYLQTSYDDHALYNIIVDHALKEWNNYFKYEFDPGTVTFEHDNVISHDIITLPYHILEIAERSGVSIEDIRKIRWTPGVDNFPYGAYTSTAIPMFQSSMRTEDLYNGYGAYTQKGDIDLLNQFRYSCWFEKPNVIRFNYGVTSKGDLLNFKSATMSFFVSQAPNLVGIAHGREQYFFELCRLHIMKVIYENETKYIENITTGTGNINLKIEEWATSGEKLAELRNQLENFATLANQTAVLI